MSKASSETGDRLRVELPFPAVLPRLANPELGLRNLAARVSTADPELTVTLLDAPDHRLVRSGVLLAHRVADGSGDWYLALPGWVQGKESSAAVEQTTPLDGEGELTAEFRTAVQPFLRRGTLGPVAALTVERVDYALRDVAGAPLGSLRDDKVTVRRAGLTTARYREVTFEPRHGVRLLPTQRTWLVDSLTLVGATVVAEFPSLVQRIGAPATGRSDFPDPTGISEATTAGWVAQLGAAGLRDLVRLLHAASTESEGTSAAGRRDVATLTERLAALSSVFDPDWVSDVVAGLGGWFGADSSVGGEPEVAERRLVVLDRLVAAVRTPPLVPQTEPDPRRLLAGLQQDAIRSVLERCGQADISGEDLAWDEAADAVAGAVAVGQLAREAGVSKSRKRLSRLVKLHDQLQRCRDPYDTEFRARAAAEPAAAFDLGREYERHRQRIEAARRQVVDNWDEWSARLSQ